MIKVEPITGPLADEILDLLKGPQEKAQEVICAMGVTIKGFFDMVCREVADNSVAWEVHQPNLLTDFGRRMWWLAGITQGGIFTSGVAETPQTLRYSLNENAGTCQVMAINTNPAVDGGAMTKTWSTTFGTPGFNRPIATVGLISGTSSDSSRGAHNITCYALINPPKVQTSTQTLEISYRLTMQAGT